jgi:deferrochelatase/peroxidase EfeB
VRATNVDGSASLATIALGNTWFAKARLDDQRPPQATGMPAFPGDQLDRVRTGGDVLVLFEGPNRSTAERGLAGMVGGLADQGAVVRWQVTGNRPENPVSDGRPLARDTRGFVQGAGNRDLRDGPAVDEVTLIRAGEGVPTWAVGGTYLALRVVRLDRAAWDAETAAVHEQIIGRRTDGRWLDGTREGEQPDFVSDPFGFGTPLDSHVRRANPRQPGSSAPPMVRRSWNYSTHGGAGREDGLLYLCYQADLDAGFTAVQRRLKDQALNDYVRTVGGGYFVVPPPDPEAGKWEQSLLVG